MSRGLNRLLVQLRRDRLKQDVVDVFALVYRIGNEDRELVWIEVIRDLRLVGHHADDFERHAVDAYRFTDGRDIAEEPARDLIAEKRHPTMVLDVFVIQKSSVLGSFRPHDAVLRRDATYAGRGLPKAVCDWYRLHILGTDELDRPELLQRIDIGLLQHDAAARSLPSRLHARLPVADQHRPLRKRVAKTVHDRALESGAVRHQEGDRDDAPRDTEHGEPCAEPMREERADRLNDDLTIQTHVHEPGSTGNLPISNLRMVRMSITRTAAIRPEAAPPRVKPDTARPAGRRSSTHLLRSHLWLA
jgi:hypothetical protein